MTKEERARWNNGFAFMLAFCSLGIVAIAYFAIGGIPGAVFGGAYWSIGAFISMLAVVGSKRSGINLRERYNPAGLASVVALWPIAVLILVVGSFFDGAEGER